MTRRIGSFPIVATVVATPVVATVPVPVVATRRPIYSTPDVDGRVRRIGKLVANFPAAKAVEVRKTFNTVPRVFRTLANVRTGQTTKGQVNNKTHTRHDLSLESNL